jgi:RNA-directed DNA polymerase
MINMPSRVQFIHTHQYIISVENLLLAWKEFLRGKKSRKDVQAFERDLMANIFALHKELADGTYKHSHYRPFNISDPKPRNIHKAKVRDRLLHHAIYRALYPFFEKTFIFDSYSCRLNKGIYKAIDRFVSFSRKVSKNDTKTVWVLKCDIRKFFASVDHRALMGIVESYIPDKKIIALISEIVSSFHPERPDKGLPLGNLTSQLLVNIYMNQFDQFMKHKIKAKHYIRYADDFVVLSRDREWLVSVAQRMQDFLQTKLYLSLHPDKLYIKTVASGVDFLGWVIFPDHKVLRTITRWRMFRVLERQQGKYEAVQSYLGLMSHGNTQKLKNKVEAMQASYVRITAG